MARNVAEYRFRHADGSWRHIEAAGTFLLEDPTVGGVLVTALTSPSARAPRRQIREAEERYRTLVEHVPAVVYVEAMDGSMTTLYDSPQIEAMLGYPRDTHEKDPDYWKRIIHPDDRERVLSTERAALAVEGPFTVEYRVFASDGRTVWVRDEAVVAQGEGDEPPYWQGFISDITTARTRSWRSRRARSAIAASHGSSPSCTRCARPWRRRWNCPTFSGRWSRPSPRRTGTRR